MEVKLIAYTPNPDGLANLCAETCVSKTIPTIKTSANGLRSLQEALDSHHESVIEHCSFTFAVSGVSRALTHQLVRHRIASYSQQSQRYVKMDEPCCILPQSIKKAIKTELYNGGGWNPNGCLESSLNEYKSALKECVERMRKLGVPEEDIRYLYPQGTITNIIVTTNARELLHFFSLRCCERAQSEIRELANKMLKICKEVSPTIFENAGPSCVRDGFCRESKSCGRAPKLENVMEIMYEMDGEASIRDEQRTAERECHR